MANHKSSKKRARQTIKRNFVNKFKMTRARTVIKKLREAIEKNDKDTAKKLLPEAQSLLSKTHLKPNNIARKTSRLTSQVNKI